MNIKTLLFSICLTLCCLKVIGQIKSPPLDSLKKEILILKQNLTALKTQKDSQLYQLNSIKEEVNSQKELINTQVSMLDTAFDGVSTEISSATYFIEIIGIIIAVLSIVLSLYLARLERNVTAMNVESNVLMERNIQIRQETEALSEKIKNDVKSIYKLIRNEESNHNLDRLISVPEDIKNLFRDLASRDLEPEHFLQLKEAFLQVRDIKEYNFLYMSLFFQHFSGLSIQDAEIKPIFIKNLNQGFFAAFKNDAVKSASDYFNAIVKIGLPKSRDEINAYVIELCKSSFSKSEEVYFAIINEMKSRDLKFALYDVINKTPKTLIFRQLLGDLILDYKFENLTPQETAIINEITKLKSE